MALIIEDGTLVTDANSVATLLEIKAYATDRGVVLSTDDLIITSQAILAMDYLESFQKRYVGILVNPDQSLSWPRKCVQKSDGTAFPETEIPRNLIKAQCQLVIEQTNGIVLMPSTEGSTGFVIREKVDVIETQYSQKIVPTNEPTMPAVDALLETLLNPAVALRSIRV